MRRVTVTQILFAFLSTIFSPAGFAQNHNHAKHKMLLLGEDEIHAYHIVYKVPHNYQVILSIRFDEETLKTYLDAKKQFPTSDLFFVLNDMDISKITQMSTLQGYLLREDKDGNKVTLLNDLSLSSENFKLQFFDELPTDLQGDHILPTLPFKSSNEIHSSAEQPRKCKIVYSYDMKCLWCEGSNAPVWCKEYP